MQKASTRYSTSVDYRDVWNEIKIRRKEKATYSDFAASVDDDASCTGLNVAVSRCSKDRC
jgi:hypothetical protein